MGMTANVDTVKTCMSDESSARDKLTQQWASFPPGNREHCERVAALGQLPSYVELLTCLQMAKDVKGLPKE